MSDSIRLTREQVRRVDALATERYHVSGLVLMENAGRNAAEIIRREFPACHEASICCGPGNNGGDGFVIARHLANAGWSARLLLFGEIERLTPDAGANFAICRAMGLPIEVGRDAAAGGRFLAGVSPRAVIVDALLGTGFSGSVRPPLAELIEGVNDAACAGVAAVDVPSGLDCDTGRPSNATVRAAITVTFVAEKVGFAEAPAREWLGRVIVADIGAPSALIQTVLEAP